MKTLKIKVYRMKWFDPARGWLQADYAKPEQRERQAAIVRANVIISPQFSDAEREIEVAS